MTFRTHLTDLARSRGALATVLAGGLLAAGSTTLAAGRAYVAQDLGTLGGTQSKALAMNESGTIVGWSETAQPIPEVHAFSWSGGVMTDLGTLGGAWSEAHDVSALGQVVGVAETADGERRAFYAYRGIMHDLNKILREWRPITEAPRIKGPLECSAPLRLLVEANGINDDGWIVGCGYLYADEPLHGIMLVPEDGRYTPEEPFYTYLDLGRLERATDCIGLDVNELNQAVGASGRQAFVWEYDTITALEAFAKHSQANAISNTGTAAGWTDDTGRRTQACLWRGGFRFDLGVECDGASAAHDLNDSEMVVGWMSEATDKPREAMLWEGCIPYRLNEITMMPVRTVVLPWDTLSEAAAIDGLGRIVGYGTSRDDGKVHAFRLRPVDAGGSGGEN